MAWVQRPVWVGSRGEVWDDQLGTWTTGTGNSAQYYNWSSGAFDLTHDQYVDLYSTATGGRGRQRPTPVSRLEQQAAARWKFLGWGAVSGLLLALLGGWQPFPSPSDPGAEDCDCAPVVTTTVVATIPPIPTQGPIIDVE